MTNTVAKELFGAGMNTAFIQAEDSLVPVLAHAAPEHRSVESPLTAVTELATRIFAKVETFLEGVPERGYKPHISNYHGAARVLSAALDGRPIPHVPMAPMSALDRLRDNRGKDSVVPGALREAEKLAARKRQPMIRLVRDASLAPVSLGDAPAPVSYSAESVARLANLQAARPLPATNKSESSPRPLSEFRQPGFAEYQAEIARKHKVEKVFAKVMGGLPFVKQRNPAHQKSVASTAWGIAAALAAPYPSALGFAAATGFRAMKDDYVVTSLQVDLQHKGLKSLLPSFSLDDRAKRAFRHAAAEASGEQQRRHQPPQNIPSMQGMGRYSRSITPEHTLRYTPSFIPDKNVPLPEAAKPEGYSNALKVTSFTARVTQVLPASELGRG